jgi:eukaryotic-like serine/threonine-protein kinase
MEPSDHRRSDITQTVGHGFSPTLTFGPYRLLQRIGEGGMGEVWVAEQVQPVHRQVALKIIKAGMDTAQAVARFEAERQALALMNHPAIATVYDGGSTPEGRPYFALEYVQGEPITTYCDRHRLRTSERLELFIRVCEGVQHAHQKGIIHRDLKPSNVLVTLENDQLTPKIIDFGVAKAITQHLTERTLFTEVGALIGTPEYMSPEQADLTGLDIDTRTDVYALGVLLYELLTGTLPFTSRDLRAKGLEEIRRTIREAEPPRPSTRITQHGAASSEAATNRRTEPSRLASQLRGDLDWITMKALEKDRTRRYDTVAGLANDVRRHLKSEAVLAGPPSALYRTKKFVRRHRWGVTAAGSVAFLLVIVSALLVVQAQRIADERDRANHEARRANQEAGAARQVADFVVGLFRVSDPSEARGNAITAREVLDKGARDLEQGRLGQQPEIVARLEATIGEVYTSLGLYSEALPLLTRALSTQRQVLGDDHQDTMRTVNLLANLYWYRGELRAAEPLYSDLVNRRRRVLGAAHRDTLRAEYDLAALYLLEGRPEAAEYLIRGTIDRQREALGAEDPETLDSVSNLAGTYFQLGQYARSEALYAKVVEANLRLRGRDHPETLKTLHNLATAYVRTTRSF